MPHLQKSALMRNFFLPLWVNFEKISHNSAAVLSGNTASGGGEGGRS
jgi:hypothetical protein